MNINRISIIIMIIMSASISMPTLSQTPFQTKGKWGLTDINGKVILKAKYDSISPFNGDYALIMSKGYKGLVKRDGKIYLPCKYKIILYPIYINLYDKDFFWASTDGQEFYANSKTSHLGRHFSSIFFGPDKKWYGFNQKWYEITDPANIREEHWSRENPPFKKLGNGYSLFKGNLYNPKGQVILSNAGSCKLTNICNIDFYSIKSNGGEELALLDTSNGELWKKEKNSIWSNGLKKKMLKGNQFYEVNILDYKLGIFTLKHPDFDLYSLYVGNREVIPFKSTQTKLYNHFKGNLQILYEIALECKSGLYSSDISDLITALKPLDSDFIISNKSGMGVSIFDKEGHEIIHHKNVDKIFYKNGILTAMIDGAEEIIDQDYDKNLLKYDAFNDSQPGNLILSDLLVKKNGKWGLYVKGVGELVPPLYDVINRLANHIYVYKDGKEGLYTKHGRKIADPVYKWIKVGNFYDKGYQYYIAKKPSGETYVLGDHGQILNSLGNIDRINLFGAEETGWGLIYKNGKMGVFDAIHYKITIPCSYDDNFFLGTGSGLSRKIGVYKETPHGTTIDIWTLGGKKIASKYFPSGTSLFSKKRFLENHLGIQLYL